MQLPSLLPLQPSDIVVGIPVACDLFSEQGRLLLRAGGVVSNPTHVETLLAAARKRPQSAPRSAPSRMISSHAMMEALSERLDALFDLIAKNPAAPGFVGNMTRLATTLIKACDLDPDAAFAHPHLDMKHSYMIYHAVMAAVITALLGKAKGLSEERRLQLVCAALTHDLSLAEDHFRLESKAELSPYDRARVMHHPVQTEALLRTLNVDHPVWLDAVANHHERLDGSGYPKGIEGAAVSDEVRIMSIADALSAMLRPRPYRDRQHAKLALAELYRNEGGVFDQELLSLLVGTLGIYPAGTVVRLQGGEVAVVRRRGDKGVSFPALWKVLDSNGQPHASLIACDAGDGQNGIAALLAPAALQTARRMLEGAW